MAPFRYPIITPLTNKKYNFYLGKINVIYQKRKYIFFFKHLVFLQTTELIKKSKRE